LKRPKASEFKPIRIVEYSETPREKEKREKYKPIEIPNMWDGHD
jgi:hypothetical protein